ncbi:hypothetical protein Dda_4208 [Drechslerella dactyloides]|uniref:Uncharacterized protein n=1 Tax=Drechslerella dactyloides TaxID=74499 RepID=A0AAD6IZB8_DREDA|nr:hypothetical protein Dda_4208 [Drechslerella dactyloides]
MPCSALTPWLPLPIGLRLRTDEAWYSEIMFRQGRRQQELLELIWKEWHTPRVDPPGESVLERIRRFSEDRARQLANDAGSPQRQRHPDIGPDGEQCDEVPSTDRWHELPNLAGRPRLFLPEPTASTAVTLHDARKAFCHSSRRLPPDEVLRAVKRPLPKSLRRR